MPYDVEMLTDQDGRFEFHGLQIGIGATCRWTTIEVTKAGYGRLRRVDEPFAPDHLTATLTLEREDVNVYVGPALAEATRGESYCVR
jgi:hypothetical protein